MAEQDQSNQNSPEESEQKRTLVVEAGALDEIKVVKAGSSTPNPIKSVMYLALLALIAVVLFFGWSLFVRLTNPSLTTNNSSTSSSETEPVSKEVPLNELGEG